MMVAPALDEIALASADIDGFAIEAFEPSMLLTINEEEQQAFHLHIATIGEKRLEPSGAQGSKPLHQHVDLVKAFVVRQLIFARFLFLLPIAYVPVTCRGQRPFPEL